ncbi:hypothetical protein FIBSPDRAFT_945653 [Athelia psychrophila]|uniref:NADP-dependent oxidoreductase domain-containing protein n=1 Tax=Athelia psychrophila TaxID=1759441 RepID=A0A166A5H5_9AGAM|nr:hypothetical protein FIBSPDRAFT_962469 [Fibularhizoctonia sp. CBS 109695]KZP30721.1 hypothetical protein FIBSPDRAFT_945653 [Fibularhizoctonia sp. CBS 109695]
MSSTSSSTLLTPFPTKLNLDAVYDRATLGHREHVQRQRGSNRQMARELGVKIVAYTPLGRGLLSGQYKSLDDFEEGEFQMDGSQVRHQALLTSPPSPLVKGLADIGKAHGATLRQVPIV